MINRTHIFSIVFGMFLWSCANNSPEPTVEAPKPPKQIMEFGYNINDYHVVRDTVRRGDSFGAILEKQGLYYPQIYNINQVAKKAYNFRKIQIGKPYSMLCRKDSLQTPEVFIYHGIGEINIP